MAIAYRMGPPQLLVGLYTPLAKPLLRQLSYLGGHILYSGDTRIMYNGDMTGLQWYIILKRYNGDVQYRVIQWDLELMDNMILPWEFHEEHVDHV